MQQVLSKMDVVVSKMDNIEKRLESQMGSIEKRLESQMGSIEKRLESKMDIQFKMILWVLGILGLLITVFKFVG